MSDITMCPDKDCPKSKTCYRFLAKSSQFQSFFRESPRKGEKCAEYWECISKSVRRRLDVQNSDDF
jgi:hypothetical protein